MRLISEYAALRVTCPKPGETLTSPTIKVNCDFGPFGVNEFSWAIYGVPHVFCTSIVLGASCLQLQ